jgi:hypothetical protein
MPHGCFRSVLFFIARTRREGSRQILETTVPGLSAKEWQGVIVGGFPHGYFSEITIRLADAIIRVDLEMLEAWTMISRVIYEYERAMSLPTGRIKRADIAQCVSLGYYNLANYCSLSFS